MGVLSGRQRMGVAAVILAASAFLSRLMGLVRDKIISWQFGAGSEADMYFAAFVVPDVINYLLAGGFMSITIIPLLSRGFAENEEDAWNFFSCIFFWMLAASIFLTGIGEIFAKTLAAMVAPGFSPGQCERLAFFMRIILPAQVFFLGGSCFTALLLLRRQFAVPAITPLVYNGAIILFGVLLPLLPVQDDPRHFGMTGYCIGVTVGAAAGAFVLPLYIAAKGGINLHLVLYHPWFKKFLFLALPLMLGQTVIMLDEQFLRIFGSMIGEGSVSLLNYGRRIAQVPVALMGQAIAMASYPFLVNLLTQNDVEKFDNTLQSALSAGIELVIPCSLWMIACITPILGLIFYGGRFGMAETLACAPLAQIMLLPGPFWIIYMVLVRGYYAYGDTLTPALTGTIATLVCIPIYNFYAVEHGSWAVAATSGASISAYVLWLVLIWAKRHGRGAFHGLCKNAVKSLACSVPAAIASWFALEKILADFYFFSLPVSFCIKIIFSGIVFTFCYIVLAYMIAPHYIKNIVRLARRRHS